MTVSRALRGLSKVSPELAETIRKTAKEMGYETDPWLTRMMTETRFQQHVEYRDTIGFVWTSLEKYGWEEFEGVRRQAERFRFRVDEFHPLAEKISGRRLSQILEARRIRGVILSPPVERHHPHFYLPSANIACVLIGSSLRNKGFLRVQNDHYQAGITAMTQLHRHGYTRPGLVMDQSFFERSWRSHAAALAAFSNIPIDLSETMLLVPDRKRRSKSSFQAWFRRRQPDVLLVQNLDTALWLASLGLKIPRDIPVALLARDANAHDWAGVFHDGVRIGQESMKAVAFKILSEEFGRDPSPPVIHVLGKWLPGPSLPKRSRTPRKLRTV